MFTVDAESIDLADVYSLDRQTLGRASKAKLLKSMKEGCAPYVPYKKRVGSGLVNLSIEIKRFIDTGLTQKLKAVLPLATDDRFHDLYCDVRVYPNSDEAVPCNKDLGWQVGNLYVFVNFVVSIPEDDSLDSMARATVLSFLQEDSWISDKKITAERKRRKLWQILNIETMAKVASSASFDNFNTDDYEGINLEIDCDGIIEAKFSKLANDARMVDLSTRFDPKLDNKSYITEKITLKNARKQVPMLIGGIANALGVHHVSPSKLKRDDSLYALMGFDDRLTRSLVQSFKVSIDVIEMIGGPQIYTVGDAIDFACEIVEYRESD
jgi:hypothetical protein